MRRTVILGAQTAAQVDTNGPVRPSWPDIDTAGRIVDTSRGSSPFAGARALSLAYETDWDLVRVVFGGGAEPQLLGPGRLLRVPAGATIARIEPPMKAPATRLYDATPIITGVAMPTATSLITVATGGPRFINRSGGVLTLYVWRGTLGWGVYGTVANDAYLDDGADNGPVSGAQVGTDTSRPADFSLDRTWTLADLSVLGKIKRDSGAAYVGVEYVSYFTPDAHGNPGYESSGSEGEPLPLYVAPSGSCTFPDLSSKFWGKLAIDVWDVDNPCEPILVAPERFATLPAIAVAAGAAYPDQPVVTFPVVNARGIEWLFVNSGPGSLFAVLVSPAATDSITGVAGVPNVDPPPAAQFVTIPSGQEGSLVLDAPRHPFAKLLVGAGAGGATIAAGSILTIKREFMR